MPEYRYANNILWGETYNPETGMHHITAANDLEAFKLANRSDKGELGLAILDRKGEDGKWQPCNHDPMLLKPYRVTMPDNNKTPLGETVIGRFDTEDQAASFIELLPDYESGKYGLVGPDDDD